MSKIAISNLPYIKKDLFLIKDLLEKLDIKDVELFIEPLDRKYHMQSIALLEDLKKEDYNISIHGPFRMVNLICNDDTEEWKNTLKSFKESIDLTEKYKGEFVVLHSNELIRDRSLDKEVSKRHLREIVDYAISKGVVPVIENVGVGVNNLFNEEEFFKLCDDFNECKVLIDVGHAIINKWNLENVIDVLKDKIIAYHIHNNNGVADMHSSIYEGRFDYNYFFELNEKYTPNSKIVYEYGIDLEEDLYRDLSSVHSSQFTVYS